MMDWIPNRLVYEKKTPCSPYASYGVANPVAMGGLSRIKSQLKFGGLL